MSKKTILLAEDDQLIATAYQAGLSAENFSVIHCDTGQKTLDQLKKKLPDLLLLDLRMPEKDGFTVLEEMKETGWIKKIPVFVTSNLDQKADMDRCKKLGAKEYLIKSNTSLSDLIKKMKEYL